MVSLYNLLPFLHATNPLIFKDFLAFMNAMFHADKCFLYMVFPLFDIFFETTFPRLLIIKSFFANPPTVLVRVPLNTCHFFPLTDTLLAFLRRRTTRFLDTLRRAVLRLEVLLVVRLRAVFLEVRLLEVRLAAIFESFEKLEKTRKSS